MNVNEHKLELINTELTKALEWLKMYSYQGFAVDNINNSIRLLSDINVVNESSTSEEKALNLAGVSNRRELLIAYDTWRGVGMDGTDKIYIDTFLEQYISNL